ncbi:GNAT family N-acetyltransferase [Leptospira sp. 'Mane']|uniref:GNAT family N-acetyltransferase n=1 Tax=Leptospira sp. 'Mane' TaxID=3387407 RepID=UPI00398B97D3
MANIQIRREKSDSSVVYKMSNALWEEIQTRYSFQAPNPYDPKDFAEDWSGVWIAYDGETPVGSIAIFPFEGEESELDLMFVSKDYRKQGIAEQLLATVEVFAIETGYTNIKLRAGEPQPEAIRFYQKQGFHPIPSFGKWTSDPTAVCFEKILG